VKCESPAAKCVGLFVILAGLKSCRLHIINTLRYHIEPACKRAPNIESELIF
jgi:hypothetical protein